MKLFSNAKTVAIAAILSGTLAACGGDPEQSADEMVADMMAEANANAMTLDDGYDACFKAVASLLGNDAKVSKIRTLISSGSDIDSMQNQARGVITNCDVEYQSPDDPNMMLSAVYDNKTGEFGEPRQLEITVIGGSASEFRVDDFVIPLSDVKYAALGTFMDGRKAELDAAFSDYEWTGVTLNAPGMSSPDHSLKLTINGRLAANNVKETGSATFEVDGTTVKRDGLLPR
ncbi:hypothetical protein [Erythrobacter crassostreae]|uniref:Lipoprotein n=1 Tax=Erythrobacter crassostreae TaxID=2828328 RepID=A0A9X1F3R7_9SPHN|nr:hypothetical protein [Erythrobacter crassostrea]MBV7258958.1 hypothetical protein [Erythrobacter crassostrea]